MPSRHLTPLDKPLPPQPWGFLATNNFWPRALLTPIAVFFTCSDVFALGWWQQALGLMAFFSVWGGLVERWSRKYLARRRTLLLAGHNAALDAAPAGARAAPPSPRDLLGESPRDLVPSREPRSEWPIVPTAEFGVWQWRLLLQVEAGAQATPALAESSGSSGVHEGPG